MIPYPVKILSLTAACILLMAERSIAQVRISPDTNLVFSGTRIAQKSEDFDSTGRITCSGYITTYYSWYSDTASSSGYQKFPTMAPRNKQFGLNMAMLSAKYRSEHFRGIVTLHVGDIPQSAWSQRFNLVQEANAGFMITKGLWFDAGFFRTHIGLESIQPRENMTISLATTTYFEPYFLAGAKLTMEAGPKLTLQANAFNGFNTFEETNRNKAFGLAAIYEPNKKLSITFNTLTCDESPTSDTVKRQRLYNNIYLVYRTRRLNIGAEVNYGLQQNTRINGGKGTAQMFSALTAVRFPLAHRVSFYIRGEYFYDPDEILTGPIENADHQLIGLHMWGATEGLEFKPIPNAYIRVENRWINAESHDTIFKPFRGHANQRYEVTAAMGVWF